MRQSNLDENKEEVIDQKEETAQGTISHMRQLSQDERINEIAQMLSGSHISPEAINNAKALCEASHNN